ncbi:bifunctional nicotinamidase/pyrazinamidase [Flammeovirga kamogawensis]|uniref:nicotinamidase n=1 Tax=Flammeovirga kamogawensis TaxID=373891 RepID=A0ABX8GU17_9BACT|nr:bifunctional nicotinamidase/pyrazinamidase [Flammeovirga kamogawensis]MBB6459931.1 nicotinamidase/pyrazinamidase [Flammeovirga kamogawensis]QWG07016.1 bifunctional nicotinamidase/pyrazinamidase [Flammeovirga kamogawensis]TRX68837.1 bifunctional nicotinamidase/pyrazinamidase [Flammeovirga kamogawensis]
MRALLIIDVQNDFIPGGALQVPEGDHIIPIINNISSKFDVVVATKDWHPIEHKSFAKNHKKKEIGEIVELNGLPQILWPEHCVENTDGAEFVSSLNTEHIDAVFKKGTDPEVDSYSGFFDNDKRNDTGLNKFLTLKGVTEIYVAGLATEYCVKFTALDAKGCGYKTFLIEDATRGVNIKPTDVQNAVIDLKVSGIKIVNSKEII